MTIKGFEELLKTVFEAKKVFQTKHLFPLEEGSYRVKIKDSEGRWIEVVVSEKGLRDFFYQLTELLDTKAAYLKGLNKVLTLTYSPFLKEWRVIEERRLKG
jgi:hypothetical protein